MHTTCAAFVDLPFPRDDKNKIVYKNTLESIYRAIPSQFNKYFLIPAEFAYELAAKFGMNIIYIGTSSCVISTIQEELKVIFSPSFKANKESVITLNKNIKDAATQAKMNNLNKESEITENTNSPSSSNTFC